MSRHALLFAAALCIAPHVAAAAETVTLRADVWYPHNGEPGANPPGYMIEIARELLGPAGIEINYQNMPWERALTMTRNGEIDCVVGAARGDAPDFVFPSESQGMDQSYAFVKKGNAWRYTGVDSLARIKIGVIDGYSYSEEIDAYIAKHKGTPNVQSVAGDTPLEQNIRKLAGGRIDAVIESRPVFLAMASKLGMADKFAEAGPAGEPSELFIACSPKRPIAKRVTQLLGGGMATLRAGGKLKIILDRYGLKDWK